MVILGMLWLAHHNPEIDWRMEEVKMMRCPEKAEKKREEKEKRKQKKEKTVEVKRVAEEWEI